MQRKATPELQEALILLLREAVKELEGPVYINILIKRSLKRGVPQELIDETFLEVFERHMRIALDAGEYAVAASVLLHASCCNVSRSMIWMYFVSIGQYEAPHEAMMQ